MDTLPKHRYTLKIGKAEIPPPTHPDLLIQKGLQPTIPNKYSLRSKMGSVYDQGQLGSCTATAYCSIIQYLLPKAMNNSFFNGSPLFLYYNERRLEGTVNQDAGAYLHTGVRALKQFGICPEIDWPYNILKYSFLPSQTAYINARQRKVLRAFGVPQNISSMKRAIFKGHPFVIGIVVFSSFESEQVEKTGVVPMPGPNEQTLGGHAMLCVGYDDTKRRFLCKNSWGTGWGDNGYCTIPYDYFLKSNNYASDFWMITKIMN